MTWTLWLPESAKSEFQIQSNSCYILVFDRSAHENRHTRQLLQSITNTFDQRGQRCRIDKKLINMAFADICCEELLVRLKTTPKEVSKWIAKDREKPSHSPSHIEWTCEAISSDGDSFVIYMRQNLSLNDDFSCGIAWRSPSGEQITLARYNGSSHDHTNKSDGTEFIQQCHIHQTTVEASQRGWSLENYAILAETYTCLDEAKSLLADDYVISGLVPNANQLPLSL